MKLKPYKEILKMAKEKIDETLAPARANRAKKQAELKIAELEEELASLETEIFEACSDKDIDFDKIINKQDKYALTERKIKQFKLIIDEMFPEK